MYRFSVVLFGVLNANALTFLPESEYNTSLQVRTEDGPVQGQELTTENGNRYFAYKGIPFARPPLGEFRFRSPQSVKGWNRVMDASKEATSCVQVQLRFDGVYMDGSEDCLYLNVYTPVGPTNSNQKGLPVFLFLYGGSFIEGTSSSELYMPGYFVERDCILVVPNYRLGLFGFLSTEDLASPGNYGLKDQRQALLWTRSNIRRFGGDPNRVTLMGQSAGASSVMHHVISPKSRGLFSAAAPLSGDTLTEWANQRSPRTVAEDVAVQLGVPFDNTTIFIETLRRMPTERLQKANLKVIIANLPQILSAGFAFTPTTEVNHPDALITELTYNSLEKGNFSRVPILMGITSLETLFFADLLELTRVLLMVLEWSPTTLYARLNTQYDWQKRIIAKLINQSYFRDGYLSSSSTRELLQYFSDQFFTRPITKTAQLLSKYTKVYSYVYDYGIGYVKTFFRNMGFPVNTHLKGAGHTEDLSCYFFGRRFENAGGASETFREADKHCRRMFKMLLNFALYGNPTPTKDPELQNITWPPVGSSKGFDYLHVAKTLKVKQNYRKPYIQLWEFIFSNYIKKPYLTY